MRKTFIQDLYKKPRNPQNKSLVLYFFVSPFLLNSQITSFSCRRWVKEKSERKAALKDLKNRTRRGNEGLDKILSEPKLNNPNSTTSQPIINQVGMKWKWFVNTPTPLPHSHKQLSMVARLLATNGILLYICLKVPWKLPRSVVSKMLKSALRSSCRILGQKTVVLLKFVSTKRRG